jgi:RimJ/RimL family protein N-acetyltransferase
MTRKKSARSFSQEELDNHRSQFARILFLKQLDIKCQYVRKDLLKIWKKLEPRIRKEVSALQDQTDQAWGAIREEVEAEYSMSEGVSVSVSGPTKSVWSWYQTAPQSPDTLRSKLEAAIRKWARKHRIDADWITNTAIENIANWYESPAKEGRQGWFPPSLHMLGTLPPEDADFQFRLPWAWEPTDDRPAVVRERIEKAFKKELNEWMGKTKKLVKELGFQEVKERPELEKHIGWLIRHRVLGQGYAEIARQDGRAKPDKSGRVTVTAGIKRASELIGFDPA